MKKIYNKIKNFIFKQYSDILKMKYDFTSDEIGKKNLSLIKEGLALIALSALTTGFYFLMTNHKTIGFSFIILSSIIATGTLRMN